MYFHCDKSCARCRGVEVTSVEPRVVSLVLFQDGVIPVVFAGASNEGGTRADDGAGGYRQR
jgi:hypothetical protein